VNLLIALCVVVFVGGLPSLALTRSAKYAAAILAPMAIAIAALGALIGVTFGISVTVTTISVAMVLDAAGAWYLVRSRWVAHVPSFRNAARFYGPAVLFAGVASLFLQLFHPAIGWDPRTMWWFHSQWLTAGGATAQHALHNPYFFWAHVDYPEGVSSLVALTWSLTGHTNYGLALALTAVLTALSLSGLCVIALSRRVNAGGIVAAILLIGAACGIGGSFGLASSGYVDILMAACVVMVVAAPMCVDAVRTATWCSVVALAGAVEIKSEALIFGVVAVLVVVATTRRARGLSLGWYVLALVPALAWLIIVHHYGANFTSDISPGDVIHIVSGRSAHRLTVITPAMVRRVGVVLLGAVMTLIAFLYGSRAFTHDRHSARYRVARSAFVLVVCSLVLDIALLGIYASGKRALSVWIPNSLARVVATPTLFVLSALVILGAEIYVEIFGAKSAPPEVTSSPEPVNTLTAISS
jgi:hypothetical protein